MLTGNHRSLSGDIARPVSRTAVNHIDHVAIAVHDADSAARWFAESFGMAVVNDEQIDQGLNVRLLFLSPAPGQTGTTLQLVTPTGDGPVARHLKDHGEGLHHLCLAVDNVSDSLTALGDPDAMVFVGGYGLRCAFLQTDVPGSVPVELVEQPPAS